MHDKIFWQVLVRQVTGFFMHPSKFKVYYIFLIALPNGCTSCRDMLATGTRQNQISSTPYVKYYMAQQKRKSILIINLYKEILLKEK